MKRFTPPCVRGQPKSVSTLTHAIGCIRDGGPSLKTRRATYSTRFDSFSVMFMALTRAAARSGGEALVSHTVLVARGPLIQSGYWNPTTPLAAKTLASAHLSGNEGFMVTVSGLQSSGVGSLRTRQVNRSSASPTYQRGTDRISIAASNRRLN